MKKYTILVFLFIIFLSTVSPIKIQAQDQLEIEMNLSISDKHRPLYGGRLTLVPDLEFSGNFEGYLEEGVFRSYLLYTSLPLNLLYGYNTEFELGFSQQENLEIGEEYRGIMIGNNWEKQFTEKIITFTNLKLGLYPSSVIPMYRLGFTYNFAGNKNIKIAYQGFNKDITGVTLGVSLELPGEK
ncbi:MAG: hypothetical protein ACOC1S_00610 [bacterium]